MARLGHASARAAMVYQHATADRDRAIDERLAAMTVEAGLAPLIRSPARTDSTARKCPRDLARIWHDRCARNGLGRVATL